MKSFVIFILFFIVASGVSADTAAVHLSVAPNFCVLNLARNEAIEATLKELLQENVIALPDLTLIMRGENPLTKKNTPMAIEFGPVIEQIIEVIQANRAHNVPLVQKIIDNSRQKGAERDDKKENTKDRFVTPRFYPIAPGSFMMGSPDNEVGRSDNEVQHLVKIDKQFWMANFPVTQWQYVMVMGRNPSDIGDLDGVIKLDIEIVPNSKIVSMVLSRPNYPVDNLRVADEDAFIAKLNDLSAHDDSRIYKVMPDHIKNWKYRKPTEEEWEFVARNRGAWKGAFPDGVTEKNLNRLAWYHEGIIGGYSHPVGGLEPILIDGKYPIYDLLGNVWERTSNGVFRGGCVSNDADFLRAAYRHDLPNASSSALSFRLVRTPP